MPSRIFLSLIVLFFGLNLSWAQQAPETKEINQKLESLKEDVKETIDDIKISITPYSVSFPEYEAAKEIFFANLDASAEKFNASIDAIAKKSEEQLSKAYSELAALEENARRNPIKPMEKLVVDQKERITSLKEKLQSEINQIYQVALAGLVSMNGNLVYVTKVKTGIRFFSHGEITLLGQITGATIALGTGYLFLVVSAFHPAAILGTLWIGMGGATPIMMAEHARDSFIYKVKSADNKKVLELNTQKDIQELRQKYANQIFKNCKTAGCAYLIAEGYKTFSERVLKFNKTVDLIDGLKLEKIKSTYKTARSEKEIGKMSKMYADLVPLAQFTEEKN